MNDSDEKIEQYKRQLAEDDLDPTAHYNLGTLYFKKGNLTEAAEEFHNAIELQPYFAEAYCALGAVLQRQQKIDEAFDCFHTAIELDPGYARAHSNIGAVFFHKGMLEDALLAFKEAVRLAPDFVEGHLNLAILHHRMRDYGAALQCAEKAAELGSRQASDMVDELNKLTDTGVARPAAKA